MQQARRKVKFTSSKLNHYKCPGKFKVEYPCLNTWRHPTVALNLSTSKAANYVASLHSKVGASTPRSCCTFPFVVQSSVISTATRFSNWRSIDQCFWEYDQTTGSSKGTRKENVLHQFPWSC